MNNNKDSKYSTIIIGGGLGGLFTGALLSKEGHIVTVLEKNRNIGGGIQSFTRNGVHFDTGMHILGGLKYNGTLLKILNYLGITNRIKFCDIDSDCMDELTYLSDGRKFIIPEGKDNFIAYFSQEFPHQKENIQKYIDKIFAIADEVDMFYLRTEKKHGVAHDEMFFQPADKLVAQYITDPKLREILSYMNPMCGGVEGHTPAYIFALINTLYINGQSRFVGPTSQLADALAEIIEANGGKVVRQAKVTEIEIENKVVKSVKTSDNRIFSGDFYISSLHPAKLTELTDSQIFSKAFRSRISAAPNTYSSFSIYIIFKENAFPYINHTCYCQDDYSGTWNYSEYDEEKWPRGFIYLTPCEENQGKFAKQMSILAMMPYSACKKWENSSVGQRGEEYEEWKKQHIAKILNKMNTLYDNFEQKIEKIYSASPLTIRDYYGVPEGALYGMQKDSENLLASHVSLYTKAVNLYLTGQNIYLHGCCGVPLTAINTAEAIVGENTILNKINEI